MPLHGQTRYVDYREYVLSMLAKTCSGEKISLDRTLELYERIRAMFSKGMKENKRLRDQVVTKVFLDWRRSDAMMRNTRYWLVLVDEMRRCKSVEPWSLDVAYMVSYLVLYEGMYAWTIDALYEALPDDDAKQCGCCGHKPRLGTGARADRLAGRGIDVRGDVPTNIRNAAAHMAFNPTGGGIVLPNNAGCLLSMGGDVFERNEDDVKLLKENSGDRLKDAGDVFQRAREAVLSLYWATNHWYCMWGGPWRLFGKEFFQTGTGIGIMERTVERMIGSRSKNEEFEKWPQLVEEAEQELRNGVGSAGHCV